MLVLKEVLMLLGEKYDFFWDSSAFDCTFMIFGSEMNYKYVEFLPQTPTVIFQNWYTNFTSNYSIDILFVIYFFRITPISWVFSSFQSVGFNNKYTKGIRWLTYLFNE